jgi:hypothetical protein
MREVHVRREARVVSTMATMLPAQKPRLSFQAQASNLSCNAMRAQQDAYPQD